MPDRAAHPDALVVRITPVTWAQRTVARLASPLLARAYATLRTACARLAGGRYTYQTWDDTNA